MKRLQKAIADYGIVSRRKAEVLIKEGHVKVNGNLINELGAKVNDSDVISIDNKIISKKQSYVYYLLNKPRGVLSSASDDLGRQTVVDLIKDNKRIYPIGRLDYNTTGLIILTNDGNLTNTLSHPKNKIYKTYVAKINGILKEDDFKKLRKGIIVDNQKLIIDNFKVKKIDKDKNTSLVEVTIHEGRNHIIKKMFLVLGYDVLKLHRKEYAFLSLDNLKSGEYRNLTKEEVKYLYDLSNKKKTS